MITRPTLAFLRLGLAALLLGGCQRDADDPAPSTTLLNTRWMLVEVDGTWLYFSSYSYDYDSYVQFVSASSQVKGLATCDAIQGRFALLANTRQLTIGPLNVTKSSCSVTNFANRYLAALPQTTHYNISGDTLRLYDAQQAKPRLVFQAAQ